MYTRIYRYKHGQVFADVRFCDTHFFTTNDSMSHKRQKMYCDKSIEQFESWNVFFTANWKTKIAQ